MNRKRLRSDANLPEPLFHLGEYKPDQNRLFVNSLDIPCIPKNWIIGWFVLKIDL